MELKDVFRGRWLWVLVTVPLVAALLAGLLYIESSEEQWEATAEFSIREFAPGQTAADIRAVVSSFDTALGSRRVADDIADISGVDPAVSFVEVLTVGEGGDIQVALSASSPGAAERALDVGVRRALAIVAEGERRRVSRELVAADEAAAQSIAVLLDLEDRAGVAGLADETARRSADILSLRNQIASAEGSELVQAALERTLAEKVDELSVIESELLPWTSVKARLDLAVSSGADASLRLQQISTGLSALENEPVLSSVRINETSDLSSLIRVAVAAAVGSAFVVVVLALGAGFGRRLDSGDPPPLRYPAPDGAPGP